MVQVGWNIVPAGGAKVFSNGFDIFEGRDFSNQVDDWFGRESWYGGAADMFDVMDVAGRQLLPQQQRFFRPGGVWWSDADGFGRPNR